MPRFLVPRPGRTSRQFKHAVVQLVVFALLGQKLFMAAALYNLPVLQHYDGVCIAHCGKAVRNHKHGAPLHQGVHALFNQRLGAGVDAGSGLVQNCLLYTSTITQAKRWFVG